MRNIGWISLACMLSLVGCGGASSSDEGSSAASSGGESGASTIVATAQGAGSFNLDFAPTSSRGRRIRAKTRARPHPRSEAYCKYAATRREDESRGFAEVAAPEQSVGAKSRFNTLVAAVQAADLVDTLNGPGPFTVFAPTDAAFAALPAGTLDNLLLPENREQLRAILTYHVVAGDVRAAQVSTMSSATTVNGAPIAIAVENGSVRLNGSATVTQADIACSNGVIHVIDQVILPPAQ